MSTAEPDLPAAGAHQAATPGVATPLGGRTRVASGAYVAAWISGLAVGAGLPAATAPAEQVAAAYAAHPARALVQELLVHGVAGAALGLLAIGLAAQLRLSPRSAALTRWAGLVAAIVSLAQAGVGTSAVLGAAHRSVPATGDLLTLVNALDVVKLILLAALVAAVSAATARRTLRWLGSVVIVGLLAGAAGLAFDVPVLTAALVPVLPAMLAWFLAAGLRPLAATQTR